MLFNHLKKISNKSLFSNLITTICVVFRVASILEAITVPFDLILIVLDCLLFHDDSTSGLNLIIDTLHVHYQISLSLSRYKNTHIYTQRLLSILPWSPTNKARVPRSKQRKTSAVITLYHITSERKEENVCERERERGEGEKGCLCS